MGIMLFLLLALKSRLVFTDKGSAMVTLACYAIATLALSVAFVEWKKGKR